jgi:hypothetical protein
MFRQAVKIASDLDNKLINAFCYQYYAEFVRSLYEFYVAIIKWNEGNTRKLNHEDLDIAMNDAVQRLLNFHAPLKSSDSTFPKFVPEKFGYHFRQVRNKVSHADYRRMLPKLDIEGITLADFFRQYNLYVCLLLETPQFTWGGAKFIKSYNWSPVEEFMGAVKENSLCNNNL